MNTDNLKPARVPGDPITADQQNILVDAAKRTITGPNVVLTPGGWHISDRPGMNDRPVVLVKKPGASDKILIVRQIGYVGRKADAGAYEWASKPFEGVPEFGFKVLDYEQFYWKPPDGVTDPVPDINTSFLYVRFVKGRWVVGHPSMADRPVVLVEKPGASDTTLTVRQISYVGGNADAGIYEWASMPFEGVPDFGAKVLDYEQFYWKPPDGVTDPVPDINTSFLYARSIGGRWLVLKPAAVDGVAHFKIAGDGVDYLVCKRYDYSSDTTAAATTYVAKSFLLRFSPFHNQTRNGISYVYSDFSTRVATKGINSIVEVLTPSYFPGDIIKADKPLGGTGVIVSGKDVVWEMQPDRQWARQ